MATKPSSTVTMEMTIATMGRLMKKRDMATSPPPARGFGATTAPSRTFCSPSTITRSPAFSPSSMTQRLSTRGPTVTLRNVTLLSAPTTAMLWRFCSSCTARCGISRAPFFVSMSNRTRPNWPGRTSRSGLTNLIWMAIVPVVVSMLRSTVSSRPVCGCTDPSARMS